MNLVCCMLVLALMGADDQTPAKAANQNSTAPFKIEGKSCGAQGEPPKEIWSLALRDAIRIGLDNSEFVRVIFQDQAAVPIGVCVEPLSASFAPRPLVPVDLPKGVQNDGSSLVISRLNADASLQRFKSEVMALVRSVEQQYWNLAEAHTAVWAAEQAVNLAQDVVEFEQGELLLSRGCITDVSEACERLEQFQGALPARKSEAEKSERQLRKLLGLPESDNRQIIPIDQPIMEHVVFDWEPCLEAMMQNQPDIVQQDAIVHLADQKLIESRKAIAEPAKKSEARHDGDVNRTFSGYTMPVRPALANTRQYQYALLRAKEFQDQVVKQSTQSLTRVIGEVESGYQHFAKAKHLRIAAAQRLKAQRFYYDEGRITADRYLDAVEQYATLVANEHHHLAAYNSALAFVSECRGTLLEERNIIVTEPRARAIGPQ